MKRIATLEKKVGPLPLSLCAWYELIGSVNFMADDLSDWNIYYSDPLYITPSEYMLKYDEEFWMEAHYVLDIAPDYYHKSNVSGGAPYCIILPNAAIDASFEDEPHETTFVDYLRIAFRARGFPGELATDLRTQLNEQVGDLLEI